MDKVREMLDNELKQQLQDMYLKDPDSEGYTEATERFAKLYKLRIEDKQVDGEIEQKLKQASDGNKDRWVKVVVDGANLLMPLGFYWAWMNKGFKFEETGAFTSTTFRGLFSRFRPTK